MEGIYEISSTERVLCLERELDRELNDLKSTIEDDNFFTTAEKPQNFSSVTVPKDVKYFRNDRKVEVRNVLECCEAKQLESQADLMQREINTCLKDEYTRNSISLILHQFFVSRIRELTLYKHLHMLRWVRFCEHTKEMEGIYPHYKKRLNELMAECSDAVDRARRLSKSREALIMNNSAPSSIVKNEDFIIYTRWLVSYFHSIKKYNAFLQVLKWIPQSKSEGFELMDPDSVKLVDSLQFDVTPDGPREDVLHASLSNSGSSVSMLTNQLKKRQCSLTKWKSTMRTNVIHRLQNEIPMLSMNANDFNAALDSLLEYFKIDMCSQQLKNSSDEMDLLNLVLRKFRQVHFRQSQQRYFEIYDRQNLDEEVKAKDDIVVYKKESNWLPYIQIKPSIDEQQIYSFAKLKESNYIDEIVFSQSRFLHIESSEKVLSLLKEHMKQIEELSSTPSFYVTSYKYGKSTKYVWSSIFNYVSHGKQIGSEEILAFDSKVLDEDLNKSNLKDYTMKSALQKLGCESEDSSNHPITNNGAYLSYLLLQHLQIVGRQQMCLNYLNYFRSLERTLTINDFGISFGDTQCATDNMNSKDTFSLGAHQYMHNTPADYALHSMEQNELEEVSNHDDFYVYKDENIYVQDQKGLFVMYDVALSDYRNLEHELLLVASHYIQKHTLQYCKDNSTVDIDKYGDRNVDRLGILLEVWTNHALFIEKKKKLIDCYYEVYQHTIDLTERKELTKVITTIMKRCPRFDYSVNYFNKSYQYEIALLSIQHDLVKSIVNDMIDDQREYIQRISRGNQHKHGLPFTVIPVQKIAVNTSSSALQCVYMLEFHPSLSIISSLPSALQLAYQQLIPIHKPKTVCENIGLEIKLIEHAQHCWRNQLILGTWYSKQIRKDIFSDVFIEDPLLVCELGESLTALENVKATRGTKTEELNKMVDTWTKILEVVTWRYRLLDAVSESDILLRIYQKYLQLVNIDICHCYLRGVSFDFAKAKATLENKPLTLRQLLDEESRVDRFIPNFTMLAIQELDEVHITVFSFNSRESFTNLLQGSNSEKLRLTLLTQVGQKNLVASAVQLMSCYTNSLCRDYTKLFNKPITSSNTKLSVISALKESVSVLGISGVSSLNKEKTVFFKKFQASVLSLQAEKTFYRDIMLNEFVTLKEKRTFLSADEIIKVKTQLIEKHCIRLQTRASQHILRSQIIAYLFSLRQLLNDFPVTCAAHFIYGVEKRVSDVLHDEDDEEAKIQKTGTPEAVNFKRRPSELLSSDGNQVINIWYLPHCSEVLDLFCDMNDQECIQKLTLVLRLVSSLHDICHYICAHARFGSTHPRVGSQPLEYAGVTADWGGSEGIGAELREIQGHIDLLSSPDDPNQVMEYLEHKRGVMFLKYDIALRHCVQNTFLSNGNILGYQSMAATVDDALKRFSNKDRPPLLYTQLPIPEPLVACEEKSHELFPWRSFLHGYTTRVGEFGTFNRITEDMKLPLLALKNSDRYVVQGEILGLSLLIEDVLSAGKPRILETLPPSRPASRWHSRPGSAVSAIPVARPHFNDVYTLLVKTGLSKVQPTNTFSFSKNPLESVKFVRDFLLLWSRLEKLRDTWGCRRLELHEISTPEHFKRFQKVYNMEILNVVYKMIAAGDNEIFCENQTDEDQITQLPKHTSDYELKIRQLVLLLEILECKMIKQCIRKITRENMLVLAERAREDRTIPTDLWKKPAIKENLAVTKPSMVDEFVENLEVRGDSLIVTIDRLHLNNCLVKLSTACMEREKKNFYNYGSFYEHLLRHQHQTLYTKEREINHLQNIISRRKDSIKVEIDCGLADKSYNLLVEITALRTKITELQNQLKEQENLIGTRLRHLYNDLVFGLFLNSLRMKSKFESYQSRLYLDVHDTLQKVRSDAVEKLKHVRVKHGIIDQADSTSRRLITAEKLREAKTENEKLIVTISKFRTINQWHRVKNKSLFSQKLSKFEIISGEATKLKLENSILFAEKEILLKEEQESLRKMLKNLERECYILKKELQIEQKLKAQQSHTQIQDAHSNRNLEFARSSNYDELLAALDKKDQELRHLRAVAGSEQSLSTRSSYELKRLLAETLQQMRHERSMKHEAFERVDELQKQVHELEKQLMELSNQEKTNYHESCLPLVSDGMSSNHQGIRPYSLGKKKIKFATRPATSHEFYVQRPKSCTPQKHSFWYHSIDAKLRQNKSEASLHKIDGKKVC